VRHSRHSSKPSPDWRPDLHTDAWSNLWSHTDRGAIDLQADDPVAITLRQHWQAQAPWLGHCATIADVGSGPAVLARLLRRLSPVAMGAAHWVCVDRAEWPSARDGGAGVGITMRTAENFSDAMPPAGGVAAVVSNFGLEYLPREGAVDALWAWLASGARLHVVMHARDSVIDRVATGNLADIAFALREARIFDHGKAMLEAMASAPVNPMDRMMHAVEVRDAYNSAVNALKARMQAAGSRSAPLMDMLQGITGLVPLVRQGQSADALARLDDRARDYAAECRRLEAMRDSAQDETGLASLVEALTATGLRDLNASSLDSALGRVAWVVSGRKP
jgi:hypothetical protein